MVAVEREVVGRCFFARQIRLPSEVRPLGVEFLVDHEQLVDVPERVFALSDRPLASHGTEHRGTQQVRGENRIERGISRVEGVGVPRRAAPVVVRSGARAPCVILIEHVGRRRRSPGHKEVTRHARLMRVSVFFGRVVTAAAAEHRFQFRVAGVAPRVVVIVARGLDLQIARGVLVALVAPKQGAARRVEGILTGAIDVEGADRSVAVVPEFLVRVVGIAEERHAVAVGEGVGIASGAIEVGRAAREVGLPRPRAHVFFAEHHIDHLLARTVVESRHARQFAALLIGFHTLDDVGRQGFERHRGVVARKVETVHQQPIHGLAHVVELFLPNLHAGQFLERIAEVGAVFEFHGVEVVDDGVFAGDEEQSRGFHRGFAQRVCLRAVGVHGVGRGQRGGGFRMGLDAEAEQDAPNRERNSQ